MTRRRWCTPPFLASVMRCSAYGRSFLARVNVLEATRLLAELGDQRYEVAQRVTGRRESVTRGDRTLGLDLERELVVVGGLLDGCRVHREGDPAHRREDRVDRDDPDRRGPL